MPILGAIFEDPRPKKSNMLKTLLYSVLHSVYMNIKHIYCFTSTPVIIIIMFLLRTYTYKYDSTMFDYKKVKK